MKGSLLAPLDPALQEGPEADSSAFLSVSELRKEFGDTPAVQDLSFSLEKGQMLALLGPSGCGKTTTLRMLAGLEVPTAGEIVMAGQTLVGTKTVVPPEKRAIGMVFQSYALWPHMTVFQNVAYPLRRRRMAKPDVAERVTTMLALVGMTGYESRPITNLSGGQQQRVAVARALAPQPHVILMDEPLSNLDAVLRESMRFEIRQLQRENNITAVYVTHNQEEALAMADIVGVMNLGRMEQIGKPEALYTTPRSEFVANFVGLANVVRGTAVRADSTSVVVQIAGGASLRARLGHVQASDIAIGNEVSISIRPQDLRVVAASEIDLAHTSERLQTIPGSVVEASFSGTLVDYFIKTAAGTMRCQTFPPFSVRVGDEVQLQCDWESCVALVE